MGIDRRCKQELIEHAESHHGIESASDVARAAADHIQQFGIFSPEMLGDLGHARLRPQIVELPRHILAVQIGHTRKKTHCRRHLPNKATLFVIGRPA
ncbi:hypothetical protein [Devosia pacifica]|uniref:hypothetical protein n=1 Tax=Devosia pacifica TaxID=1335967 RepID=UPI00167B4A6E|nr:hypothetical protein [Devosia pacifica]